MNHRFAVVFAFAAVVPLAAQTPAVPTMPALAGTSSTRFVDFHRDLARSDVVVVLGTLGKGKEGKRERLPDGKLGGAGSVVAITGTQFFKVPVQAPVQPRATFAGKVDKPSIAFDVQIARLPDGKEQRQSTTATAAPMDEGMLALFVLAPRDKKGFELLHVIPFDAKVDTGPDAEAVFGDTMADVHAINRRMLDLENALAAADRAKDDAQKKPAIAALKDLLDKPLELRRAQNDGLLAQYVAPLEARAKKRVADAAAPTNLGAEK